MAEVRKLIRACKCDVVLVRKFDRLDRSHEIRAVLRYEARRFGVQYASVVEGMVDETPNGRLNDFILAFIGEGELDSITERAVRGMRNRADKGLPLGGPEARRLRAGPHHGAGRGHGLHPPCRWWLAA
jgi:DNA invertase Pin-like site-specific DNA recombinase